MTESDFAVAKHITEQIDNARKAYGILRHARKGCAFLGITYESGKAHVLTEENAELIADVLQERINKLTTKFNEL